MIWTLPCFPNATLIITAVTNFAKIDFTLVQCLHLITIKFHYSLDIYISLEPCTGFTIHSVKQNDMSGVLFATKYTHMYHTQKYRLL